MATKKKARYLKASELMHLHPGDSVRVYRHHRRADGFVDVLKGSVVTVGAVRRMNGAVVVEDRLGDVIGSTMSQEMRLERV